MVKGVKYRKCQQRKFSSKSILRAANEEIAAENRLSRAPSYRNNSPRITSVA
jgi:hypothetical protein